MKFRNLHENLRKALVERINEGQLTGVRLAQLTGFKQAHISNFLNRKRSLSIDGMDKVLTTQHMSVLDLLDLTELNKRASALPLSQDEFENVALTERTDAADPFIVNDKVKQILKFRKSFLKRLRAETEGGRASWDRFIAIRVDAHNGASMYPRLQPGATVLVDRHYNSLKPYRKGDANIYAIWWAKSCALTYAEMVEGQIVLRPHNRSFPVEVLSLEAGRPSSDYIVGRVCYVGAEA
jgi:hypothetical protein